MRFSLLMLTRDRPQYIRQAVDSIIAQDFKSWELIIKDGGESSISNLLPYPEPRIKYQHMPGSDQQVRLELAMRCARGDIRNFCADDDFMCLGTLRHVSDLVGFGNALWLYGRIAICDEHLRPGNATMGKPWDREAFKYENFVPAPAVFWTREAEWMVGRFNVDRTTCFDYDYWLRLAERCGDPIYTERILSHYRMHGGQDSVVRSKQVAEDYRELLRQAQAGVFYQ